MSKLTPLEVASQLELGDFTSRETLLQAAQIIKEQQAEIDGLKAEPFDTREGLSKWRGWDDSNYPWSQTHHKDSVLEAMFRDSWSVEDAAALLGFIDRTWGGQSNEA